MFDNNDQYTMIVLTLVIELTENGTGRDRNERFAIAEAMVRRDNHLPVTINYGGNAYQTLISDVDESNATITAAITYASGKERIVTVPVSSVPTIN